MCILTDNVKAKSFTGYKVVLKKDNKYYSPATMIEYIVGEDINPKNIDPIQKNYLGFIPIEEITHPDSIYKVFEQNMVGRTSVLVDKAVIRKMCGHVDIEEVYYHGYDLVIIKMTISKSIMIGYYGILTNTVFAGKHIDKIIEVETITN